jgi:WD40 repeat protein
VSFTPDGKTLASAHEDGTVTLWEVATGRPRASLKGHKAAIRSVAFTPDSKTLASGSLDGTVNLWDVTGLSQEGSSQRVNLPGKALDRLWTDLAGADPAKAYQAIWAMAAGPGQSVPFLQERLRPVAPADPQRVARLIADLDSKQFPVREKAAQELETVGELARPALRRTLAGRRSEEVRRRVGRLLEKLDGPVTSPEQLRGLRAIEVLEQIGTPEVRQVLHTLTNGVPEAKLTQEAKASLDRLARRSPVARDDATLASAGKTIRPEPKEHTCFAGHTAVVSAVAVTSDGKTLASGSYDATIKLWDLATGKETATLRGHTAGVYSVVFAPNGKTLASASHDDTARLWDVASGKEVVAIKHGYHVKRVVFTPDGKTLISAGEGPIKLWDVATARERATLDLVMAKANMNLVLSMAVTSNGKVLCTGHGDGNLMLWDLTTGKKRATIRTNDKTSERHVPSVAFTADGTTVACGISHGAVKLWDVDTGQERRNIAAHGGRVWGLAFSPDGKTLASGAWDGTVKLWDVATGQERASFTAHDNRVYALAFTPDGKTLVSGGGIQFKRGEAKAWDVAGIVTSKRDR